MDVTRRRRIFCDGSFQNGKVVWGILVTDTNGNPLQTYRQEHKCGSANVAEYLALVEALEFVRVNCKGEEVDIYTDSETVIFQISGVRRCKSKRLLPLMNIVNTLRSEVKGNGTSVSIIKISSSNNRAHNVVCSRPTMSDMDTMYDTMATRETEYKEYMSNHDVNEWEPK